MKNENDKYEIGGQSSIGDIAMMLEKGEITRLYVVAQWRDGKISEHDFTKEDGLTIRP